MDIKEITQADIKQAQAEAFKLLEDYKNAEKVSKEATINLVRSFALLVDLQNDFINQLIMQGQILADYINNKPQGGNH